MEIEVILYDVETAEELNYLLLDWWEVLQWLIFFELTPTRQFADLSMNYLFKRPNKRLGQKFLCVCRTRWCSGMFCALWPEGRRLESTSSHCVATLDKLLTHDCLGVRQRKTTSLISSPGGVKTNESAIVCLGGHKKEAKEMDSSLHGRLICKFLRLLNHYFKARALLRHVIIVTPLLNAASATALQPLPVRTRRSYYRFVEWRRTWIKHSKRYSFLQAISIALLQVHYYSLPLSLVLLPFSHLLFRFEVCLSFCLSVCLVPWCAWLLSSALEVSRLRLRLCWHLSMFQGLKTLKSRLVYHVIHRNAARL